MKSNKMFFKTADDALAAFLIVRGVRRFGFGFAERDDGDGQEVTHGFDDDAAKLHPAVVAYQSGEEDHVQAGEFTRHLRFLRQLRLDAQLREHRASAAKLAATREAD